MSFDDVPSPSDPLTFPHSRAILRGFFVKASSKGTGKRHQVLTDSNRCYERTRNYEYIYFELYMKMLRPVLRCSSSSAQSKTVDYPNRKDDCISIYIYMYVCMYICMYICMYV